MPEDEREARAQHLEYILNHDGIGFLLMEGRRHHICRRHRAARTVIRTGHLPATFRCPLAKGPACPMQQIQAAAGHRPVHLRVEDFRLSQRK